MGPRSAGPFSTCSKASRAAAGPAHAAGAWAAVPWGGGSVWAGARSPCVEQGVALTRAQGHAGLWGREKGRGRRPRCPGPLVAPRGFPAHGTMPGSPILRLHPRVQDCSQHCRTWGLRVVPTLLPNCGLVEASDCLCLTLSEDSFSKGNPTPVLFIWDKRVCN